MQADSKSDRQTDREIERKDRQRDRDTATESGRLSVIQIDRLTNRY